MLLLYLLTNRLSLPVDFAQAIINSFSTRLEFSLTVGFKVSINFFKNWMQTTFEEVQIYVNIGV